MCSAANQGCCEQKISSRNPLTNDWEEKTTQHWKTVHFGDCAKKLFKVS